MHRRGAGNRHDFPASGRVAERRQGFGVGKHRGQLLERRSAITDPRFAIPEDAAHGLWQRSFDLPSEVANVERIDGSRC